MKLKKILTDAGLSQKALAKAIGVSPATVAQLVNHSQWPKSIDAGQIKKKARAFLKEHGVSQTDIDTAFESATPERCSAPVSQVEASETPIQEVDMLLRKEALSQTAKRHFGLRQDPFGDIRSHDDVFVSPDIRYVIEAMVQTAKLGGFTAITGESGAGKTTLIEDVEERLLTEAHHVVIIRPFVLGMEGNDDKGRRLKATSILDAILRSIAPDLPRRSMGLEDKSDITAQALRDSFSAGNRHCLLIEEAHRLPLDTLKHLKGLHELKIGRTPLLSILLIGQNELDTRLSPANKQIREVSQRCEIVKLAPLDSHLDAFLKHKFDRIGKPLSEVIDASGIEAIRARLTVVERDKAGKAGAAISLLYPLAVENLLALCMNFATYIGAPKITAEVVKGA